VDAAQPGEIQAAVSLVTLLLCDELGVNGGYLRLINACFAHVHGHP